MLVCLFWTIFLLTSYIETHNRAKGQLAVFMLVATLLYGCHYVFFNHFDRFLPLTDTVYVYANLSVFPLYLRYIEELVILQRRPSWWKMLLQFLPFLVACAVLIFYVRMTPAETRLFIDSYLYEDSLDGLNGTALVQAYLHQGGRVLFALQVILVFWRGNRLLRQYEHELKANYADLEGKSLQPLRFMLMLFSVVSIFAFISNIIGRQRFIASPMLLAIPSLSFSFFLYYLGYLGHRQDQMQLIPAPDAEPETKDDSLQDGKMQQNTADETLYPDLPLRERIERLMTIDHFFLQPNLKINDLAVRLGSNRNYIYEAVNVEMGIPFNEYINRQRIEYAQQLLRKEPSRLLTEVAIKSGFSSPVSFYRSFKKYVGCAPKEWAERLPSTDAQPSAPDQNESSEETEPST